MPTLNDDPLVKWMRDHGIAVTRENYIDLAWGNDVPEPWDAEAESRLPEELQRKD